MKGYGKSVLWRARLEDIADVRGGYVGPNATTENPGPEEWRALQASDVYPDGAIRWKELRYTQPIREGGRYAIRPGDVLLPLRAARPRAVAIEQVPVTAIAVGQWAIMTPGPRAVSPGYLAWYLNHPTTASRLARATQGTNLPFLSLAAVRDFEVEVPPLEMQERIARVDRLHKQVAELEQALVVARQEYMDTITMEALHRATPLTPNS